MRTILSLLLIILLFGGSLGYVSNKLQDPKFLVEQTREVDLYGRLSGQLDQTLPADFVEKYPLSNKEVAEVIKDTITADEFYEFISIYSTAYLDYWNKRTNQLTINYSLVGIKERAKTSLTNKLLSNYNNLPECSVEQTRNWDIAEEFPVCRLAAGSIAGDSIDRQLKEQVNQVLGELPDEIVTDGANEQQAAYRENLSKANTVIKITWITILILILLMITIFRAKAFILIGISLLFVGIIQIGFGLVAWDWIATTASDYFAGSGGSQFTPLVIDLTGAILEVLKTALGNLTIVILGSGTALLVLGIISAVGGRKNIVS